MDFHVTCVCVYNNMCVCVIYTRPLYVRTTMCTFGHVLSDDVDGFLRHHGVEGHQLVVPQLLHDLGLLEEGLGGHGAWLQGLNRHLGGAVPRS